MEPKHIIFVLVLAIVLVSTTIVFKTAEKIKEDNLKEESATGGNEEELPQLKPGSDNSEAGSGSSGSGEGAGESGGESAAENKTLPQDINTQPCGFYFVEYGICTGSCPSGSCLQDGKSCYCKQI